MPQIHPLILYCPSASQIEQSKVKSVEGPKSFVDIITKAENHSDYSMGLMLNQK